MEEPQKYLEIKYNELTGNFNTRIQELQARVCELENELKKKDDKKVTMPATPATATPAVIFENIFEKNMPRKY